MNVLVRILLAVPLALGAIATAGDQAPPAPGAPSAPAPAEPTATPEPTPTPSPTPTPDPGEQLEEFVPSEKVRADQAVAFPVDI